MYVWYGWTRGFRAPSTQHIWYREEEKVAISVLTCTVRQIVYIRIRVFCISNSLRKLLKRVLHYGSRPLYLARRKRLAPPPRTNYHRAINNRWLPLPTWVRACASIERFLYYSTRNNFALYWRLYRDVYVCESTD